MPEGVPLPVLYVYFLACFYYNIELKGRTGQPYIGRKWIGQPHTWERSFGFAFWKYPWEASSRPFSLAVVVTASLPLVHERRACSKSSARRSAGDLAGMVFCCGNGGCIQLEACVIHLIAGGRLITSCRAHQARLPALLACE